MTTYRRKLLIGGLAIAGAAAGMATALFSFRVEPARDGAVEQLLRQSYPDANGAPIDLSRYRGQVLVINFWATWCAPCVEEMPELSEIQAATQARGVQVLGLAVDSSEKIRQFNQKIQVVYPLLALNAGGIETSRNFGNVKASLPFTVVVDRAGNIVDQTLGRFNKAQLLSVIEQTLKQG